MTAQTSLASMLACPSGLSGVVVQPNLDPYSILSLANGAVALYDEFVADGVYTNGLGESSEALRALVQGRDYERIKEKLGQAAKSLEEIPADQFIPAADTVRSERSVGQEIFGCIEEAKVQYRWDLALCGSAGGMRRFYEEYQRGKALAKI